MTTVFLSSLEHITLWRCQRIANTVEAVELGCQNKPSPLPLSVSSPGRLTMVARRSALISNGGMATFPPGPRWPRPLLFSDFLCPFCVASSSKALRPSFNANGEKGGAAFIDGWHDAESSTIDVTSVTSECPALHTQSHRPDGC